MLLWAPSHLTLLPWDRNKTLMWDIPSLYLEERNTLVSKTRQKDAKENPNKQVLLSFPSYYTYLALLALSYLPWLSTLLKASTEILKSSSFLRFQFLTKTSVSHKTYIKYICIPFLLLICLCQFNFQTQSRPLRAPRRTFPSLHQRQFSPLWLLLKARLLHTQVLYGISETEFWVKETEFITLPGKGDHSGLMPSKPCIPTWGR